MKFTSISWLLSATAVSAVSNGRVLLLDSLPTPNAPSTVDSISPQIARLIFAQRLALSDGLSIQGAEPAEIEQVDRFSGPNQHPLTGSKPNGPRLLLVVDGVQDFDTVIPKSKLSNPWNSFNLVPAPHPDDTAQLLAELTSEATRDSKSSDDYLPPAITSVINLPGNTISRHGERFIIRISPSTEIALIRSLIDAIADYDFSAVTIYLAPPAQQCSKRVGATKMYGIQRRAAAPLPRSSEIPLSNPSSNPSPPKIHVQAPASILKSNKPIPPRFNSLESCQRVTANCTGHGSCVRVAKEQMNDRVVDIFSCACKPQVKDLGKDGTQTTYYGGSACQKVSHLVPFWLLAGTAIFLTTIVSLGVGMLYTMGSEELPSVIGAGVSGPRAK